MKYSFSGLWVSVIFWMRPILKSLELVEQVALSQSDKSHSKANGQCSDFAEKHQLFMDLQRIETGTRCAHLTLNMLHSYIIQLLIIQINLLLVLFIWRTLAHNY